MKYRAKHNLIDAFIFDADAEISAPAWFNQMIRKEQAYIDRAIEDGAVQVYGCTIITPTGNIRAKIGDYIIMEKLGAVRCMKPDQFRQQYEKVET